MAMTFTSNFTKLVKLLSFAPYAYVQTNTSGNYIAVGCDTLINLEGEETSVKIYNYTYYDINACRTFGAFAPNVYNGSSSKWYGYYTSQYPSNGVDNIILGTGTPSSHALGSPLSNSVITETSRTYTRDEKSPKVTMKMVYQNKSSNPVTITEIGTYKCIYQDSYNDSNKDPISYPARFCMTAYEQLETPVTVPAGSYFNLTLTFTLNI